jgi:tetratricopeptide (TPR) repeat protein
MNPTRNTNRIIAVVVFLISLVVYIRTMANTTSFWDCGEFIACSYTLSVPHPPGAPFFLLVGRLLSMFPFFNDVGFRVNMISPITGALAMMLVYLIIVRLIRQWRGPEQTSMDKWIVYVSGVVGSLALAFSRSVWFNAVEAEVYSFSLFFTALCLWLILVWAEKADNPGNERILLLIAYLYGLAIGVHLLNLLTIPFVGLVFFYRKFNLPAMTAHLALQFAFAIGFFLLLIAKGSSGIIALFAIILLGIVIWELVLIQRHGINSFFKCLGFWVIAGMMIIVINPGLIQGIPTLADKIGPAAPILLFLILAGLAWWAVTKKLHIPAVVISSILLIVIGYATYSMIFIRSSLQPAIDENDPDTLPRILSYLKREQYGERSILTRQWDNNPNYSSQWDFFWRYQMNHMYNRYLLWQFVGMQEEYQDAPADFSKFYAIPFLVGLLGLAYHFQKDEKRALAVLVLFFMMGYALIFYMNEPDPEPRERDYTHVGSFLAFAVWIGIGAAAILEWLAEKLKEKGGLRKLLMGGATILLIGFVPLNMVVKNFHVQDRNGNYVAWDYSYNILETCAPDAVIFTNGDNDTFPVWYLQEVVGVRKDVRVVNLSLLNTGWYIKQLKHREPKVPISFTDEYIDTYLDQHDVNAIMKRYWPKDKWHLKLDSPDGPLSWECPATMYVPIRGSKSSENNFLRVQDIMILDIIRTNNWKKPIYFAVTVSGSNMMGLRDYLQMEGLALRLVSKKDQIVEPDLIWKNLTQSYGGHYRNLDNPKVHYDDNIEKLVQNYRSAFLQLAYYYSQQTRTSSVAPIPYESLDDKVAHFNELSPGQKVSIILDKMESVLPEDIISISNVELEIQVGLMYYNIGRPEELGRRLDRISKREGLTQMDLLRLASVYMQYLNNDSAAEAIFQRLSKEYPGSDTEMKIGTVYLQAGANDKAEQFFNQALSLDADNGQAVGGLLRVYDQTHNYEKAVQILEKWGAGHPNDPSVKREIEKYRAKMTNPEKPMIGRDTLTNPPVGGKSG